MTKLKYVAEGSPSREKVSLEHPYQLPHSFVALLPNAGGTRGHGSIPAPLPELETRPVPSRVKSLTSKATPSATQFFKRSYKISHNPGL